MSAKASFVLKLFCSIVLLDQLSKFAVNRLLPLNESVPVIDDVFSLTYIRNKGAAFGMFAGSTGPFRLIFLVLFSVLAIGFIVKILKGLSDNEKWLLTALSFILGGAAGNLIDRLIYGEVIDFLDFYWSSYHWPAFNVADSFISVGVVIILFRLILSKGSDPFSSRE